MSVAANNVDREGRWVGREGECLGEFRVDGSQLVKKAGVAVLFQSLMDEGSWGSLRGHWRGQFVIS